MSQPSTSTPRAAFDVARARAFLERREASRHAEREKLRRRRLAETRESAARLGPGFPGVRSVYLFGSLLKPGRFSERSDIDLAVDCDDVETESRFWAAIDRELGGIVDLRPLAGAVAEAVDRYGERVYERKAAGPRT